MKKKNKISRGTYHYGFGILLFILLILLTIIGCRQDYTPKPDGYFRIDPHQQIYQTVKKPEFPLTFEIPQNAHWLIDSTHTSSTFWLNIIYPRYNATVYCSYLPIDEKNKTRLFTESKDLVYRHGVKAEKIQAQIYENPERHLYATLYSLTGNTATPLQFTATDSTSYLFRGALYFNTPTQSDSIAPVIKYITQDMIHLIETLQP
ncbi:gliding motility lipoprotein GldD [Coprobacter sp.]